MKILFINTFYSPYNAGGAENSLRIIVEAMQSNGHEVVVMSTCDKKGLHQDVVNGVKVYRAGIENSYWIYDNMIKHSFLDRLKWHIRDRYNKKMSIYVRKVVEIEKPDIASCHNVRGWSISIWDELKKNDIPTVQVLHDFYLLCRRGSLFNKGKVCEKRCVECQIIKSIHRRKSQKIDAVVGVCQDILDIHVRNGYFNNALKLAIHNVRNIPNNNIKKNYQNAAFVFGYIGSLTEFKGVLWLIEQFKKTIIPNIFLKIAGKGDKSYEDELKLCAKDDQRIAFLGYTKSEDFYSNINVLVIPSIWYEPLASVAIEACANHIPVISSGMGGLKEVIINNKNGLVCDYNNPNTLSEAMTNIANDKILYDRLRNSARLFVNPFMDLERLMNSYERVYKEILNMHSSEFIK
jgi:glycosyltransferase involved in cell wall biosynthesis